MLIVIVTVGMENKMPQTMENCLPHSSYLYLQKHGVYIVLNAISSFQEMLWSQL